MEVSLATFVMLTLRSVCVAETAMVSLVLVGGDPDIIEDEEKN